MEEITFQVQSDEQSGFLTACWDDSDGAGGITTQGKDLRDLQEQITEAVGVHFDAGTAPRSWFRRDAAPGPIGKALRALERLGFSAVRQTCFLVALRRRRIAIWRPAQCK